MKVDFYRHSLDENDFDSALAAMRSVFLSAGPISSAFEEKFAAYTGLPHSVALNSGTAALHLALMALNLGPGQEVITTPMTFIASVNAILYVGATPVLADVEPDTGLIDPAQVARKITPRTKAILPVHMYGVMADMQNLAAIAARHNLYLVEDSAHCLEAVRQGARPGHLSDLACYSFYATKNLTCGEGGAIATKHQHLAERVRSLRQHGMSRQAAGRFSGAYQHWDMVELGFKYNPNDILSALMLNQIERLPALHQQRQDLYARYTQLLAGTPGVQIPAPRGTSGLHLYTVWVPDELRDEIICELGKAGIGVTVNYRAVHTLSYYVKHFGFKPADFPNAYKIGQRTISLPFYPGLKTEEQEYVATALKEIMGRLYGK